MKAILKTERLNAFFESFHAVRDVNLEVTPNSVYALIGPSGCGKSTLLRTMNRLHEETAGASVQGKVILEGKNIYDAGVDPVAIRRRIGMVFQKPNPFPSMSIFDNTIVGLKLAGIRKLSLLNEVAERSLKRSALWDEVKDKLKEPSTSLSGGQQQRLCIARALAIEPPVLLMDEPTSALDPISTARIEELVTELKKLVTVVIVTHNMQQASRISDSTGFMYLGELVESDKTSKIFTNPHDERTERYVTGRYG